jgi:hypothetical protein
MKGGTQAALVLGVGYVLGRRHKLRTATLLAAAAATGGLGGLGGAALRRGIKTLGSTEALGGLSPQLAGIAETVRGDLVDAGKAAAIAAVNNRIGSLSDTLHERAESLRNPVGDVAEGAGAVAGGGRQAAQEAGRRVAGQPGGVRRRRRPEDGEYAADSGRREQDGPDGDGAGPEDDGAPVRRGGAPPVRRRPAPARSAGGAGAGYEGDDEEETAEPGDADERRVRPVRRAPRGRPVVSRPRR